MIRVVVGPRAPWVEPSPDGPGPFVVIDVEDGDLDRDGARLAVHETLEELLEAAAEQLAAASEMVEAVDRFLGISRCRVCGCTDDDCEGCIERTGGPCVWRPEMENELGPICSACTPMSLETARQLLEERGDVSRPVSVHYGTLPQEGTLDEGLACLTYLGIHEVGADEELGAIDWEALFPHDSDRVGTYVLVDRRGAVLEAGR